MRKQITQKNFISVSHKGILNGVNDYTQLINRDPDVIPEYVFTTSVAKTLKEFYPSSSIFLEYKPRYMIYEAGASGRGRYSDFMRKDGRIDIVLYDSEDSPLVPIEIKKMHLDINESPMKKLEEDIFRIETLVSKNSHVSSIIFGAVVFYMSVFADQGGNDRLEKISERFCEKFDEFQGLFLKKSCLDLSRIYSSDALSWRSGVIIISDK
ncbi:hypothetical protein [Tepidiphilus baoligensis]|uniref:Uncharacterized protein n=1 Tax=Tepidiphilus baoligensis TaxID=2698687 RepID=A0ABX1QMR8_9PROT|nr:hypothetical protein [Tepidiphilus baoligensis]NMH16576.1 hypothetical protein [Tepidiphilus baoligensis]